MSVSGRLPQEPSDALMRSRIDHWLRARSLVMYHADMNKSMGYAGTIEAVMALLDDLNEYALGVSQKGPQAPI